ncbi:MAG: AraC family ligand binding domain-containing protein, partial [Desulfovibrionaceae bacterium]
MAAAMDSSPSSAPERARFGRPAGLPGVELLTARFVTQTFSRHTHEGYAIGVIDAGALGFRYRGEAVVAPAGSVNLVVPGEAHDGHAADAAGWAYRMFYLPPERLAEAEAARRGADPDRGRLPHFRPGVIHDPVLAAQVARVHDALARPGTPRLARQELLAGLLERWVAGWAEASSLGGPAREPAADRDARVRGGVARAREFLHQTFPDDPGLPELARAAGLSPYH